MPPLLGALIEDMKKNGSFTLADCIAKSNTASLRTHLSEGFCIASDEGFNYLENTKDSRDYSMEYKPD